MRQTGNGRTEASQGQPNRSTRSKAATGQDTKPLTQDELLQWWPFKRLDPKLFPRRRDPVEDVEDALI